MTPLGDMSDTTFGPAWVVVESRDLQKGLEAEELADKEPMFRDEAWGWKADRAIRG